MISAIMIIVAFIILCLLIYYLFFSTSSQVFGRVYYRGNRSKKEIALTFDDGPNEPYTTEVLSVLKRHNILATFFPVGENIQREPNVLKEIDQEGHEIGLHGFTHAFFAPFSFPSFSKEILDSKKIIFEITAKDPIFFRPPWFLRTRAMLQTARKNDLTTVTGMFGSRWEVLGASAGKITSDAITHTKPGTILVFHDGYNNKKASRTQTVEALKILIPFLKSSGYKFVTVSKLLNMS